MTIDLHDLLTEAMTRQVQDVRLPPALAASALRRHRSRQRALRVGVAAATTGALAGGALVGVHLNRPLPRATISPAAPTSQPAPARDFSQFNAALVDSYFPATGAEATLGNSARSEINAVTQEVVSPCSTGTPAAHETVAQLADESQDPTQWPDLAWIAAHKSFTVIADTGVTASPSKCIPPPQAGIFPSLTDWADLSTPWLKDTERIESSPAILAALQVFRGCVIAAGATPRDAATFTGTTNIPDGASAAAFGDFIGFAGGPAGPTYDATAIRAREAHWVPVFLRCAKPVIDLQEAAQSAAKTAFLAEHASQLQALLAKTDAELAANEGKYGTPS